MAAPPWVLLKRKIYFEHDAAASGGASEGVEPMGGAIETVGELLIGGESGITGAVLSPHDTRDAILAYLQILKPDARFADPPDLSSLRILRPTESIPGLCGNITSALIASADRNLVALYAGPYRPGNNLGGGYLIYDASKNSLSTIPRPPNDRFRPELGLGAVVVCLEAGEEDAYLLGELTKIRDSNPHEATLRTWRPSSAEWTVQVASFPPELSPPDYYFHADTCFSYRASVLCWVDLFKGMVICDVTLQTDARPAELRFVPLPPEWMTDDRSGQSFKCLRWPEESRSIACVDGSIKLVTVDGVDKQSCSVTIWTLSTDLCCWNEGREYRVRDIWESEAYRSLGLPNISPSFPVLSMDGDDVVCLLVTHWHVAADRSKIEYTSQYLLCVDMQNNKVSQRPTNTQQLRSPLFASCECSAYYNAKSKNNRRVRCWLYDYI